MVSHKHHRFFIAITAIVILIVGVLLGDFLGANTREIDFEAIKIGLMFTTIILLLIIGSLVLEIKEIIESKKRGK